MSTSAATASTSLGDLFASAYRDILANKARLPSLPNVAISLRKAMNDKNHNVRTVARVIQADASTTAYLIHVANSPIYRGVSPVENVETGISRLGLNTTRNLATSHAMRSMFRTRSPVLAKIMLHVWKQSARTAAYGAILSRQLRMFEPDRAMLAGLLQDIGILPLVGALEGHAQHMSDTSSIMPALQKYSSLVGVAVLKHWDFDGELIEVARSRHDYARDPQPMAQLADLILVARVLANVAQTRGEELPNVDDVPAFKKLNLDQIGAKELQSLLASGNEDVKEVLQLLGG